MVSLKRWFPIFALGAIERSRHSRRSATPRWDCLETLEFRQLMAGTPAQLAFIVQPSQVAALSPVSPSIQVAVEDVTGVTVTTDNSTVVTLVLSQNPIGGGFATTTITAKASGGIANFTNVSFTTAGIYAIAAASGTLAQPISNLFTVTQPAAKLGFVQAPTNATAGSTTSISVGIQDANGNIVTTDKSTVTLTIVSGPGGGTISGTTSIGAINGVATFNGLSFPKAGTYTIQARDGSLTVVNSASFTVTPGAPSQLAFVQQPTNTPGSGIVTPAPVVDVLDAQGNIVTADSSTITLSILIGPGGSSIAGTASAVASNGVASFPNISFPIFGNYTLQATDGTLKVANSNNFAVTGPAAQLTFQIQPKQITAGHTSSSNISVLVTDSGSNVVANDSSPVTLSVVSGPLGGSINGTTTVTAVNGIATFSGLSFSVPGNYILAASDGSLTNATSNSFLVNGIATQLVFAQQPAASAANSVIPGGVTINVEDANGNIVIDDSSVVTISLNTTASTLGGTTQVAAFNGIASFSQLIPANAGTFTLIATDGLLTAATSSTFTVAPPPSKVVITQQPVNVAATSTMPAIVIKVENPDSTVAITDTSKVTLAIVSGPSNATLSGTTSINAIAGVATFSNLKFSTPGTYQLVAFDGSLATDTSLTFTVTGPPAKLAFLNQPPSTTVAGAFLPARLMVAVRDASGNLVSTDTSTITLTGAKFHDMTDPNTASFVTSITAVAVNGIATFPDIAPETAGTSNKFTVTDGTLAQAITNNFKVTADASTAHLSVVSVPTSTLVGTKPTTTIVIDVIDQFNNIVTTDSSTITLTKLTGLGNVTGTLSIKAVKGIASFSNIIFSQAGGYTIKATDAKFSSPSTVTNGTASLSITVSPAITIVKAPAVSSSYVINKTITLTDTLKSLVATPIGFTGNVHFVETVGTNSTNIATATIATSGAVKFTNIVTNFTVGAHTIRIVYDGDNNHTGGQSPGFTINVVAPNVSTIALALNPPLGGTASSFAAVATISTKIGTVPTGLIEIEDVTDALNPVIVGTITLAGPTPGTFTLTGLSAGTHKYRADYLGDNIFKPSFSSIKPLAVT